jgi:hypothetical protein
MHWTYDWRLIHAFTQCVAHQLYVDLALRCMFCCSISLILLYTIHATQCNINAARVQRSLHTMHLVNKRIGYQTRVAIHVRAPERRATFPATIFFSPAITVSDAWYLKGQKDLTLII